MKAIGLFAGVGGIELGFEQNGFDIIWANEIDEKASVTYKLNHDHQLVTEDINNIDSKTIPDIDVLLAGFPCQAFSVAGYRKGFEDERGNLFFQVARVLRDKRPSIVFLENVKNLVGHDGGNTFRVILETLNQYGYFVKHKVLNASEYGNVPQNRERIYIVGFLDEHAYKNFKFPDPIPLTKTLNDVIDFDSKVDDKYYYTKEKYKFYDQLQEAIVRKDTLYQWRRVYVRENKSNLCPTLTANMGTGGHNVPLLLSKYGIRKLTPRECFLLQGFPEDFILPNDMAQSHLYKQAGNSVVVPVVSRIAKNIYEAVSDIEKEKYIIA
ncbi:DNA cytosine methyltransferase [Caldifermentibacillus hisashii]|uniref:DNA cytosine methyltransferase n=1 Tax=Caldifermentibacillus hisashii TaxID=996558 RepID=UPI002E1B4F93|nr:DNA cytosine methyltransferase [Caldifermentibacillus hisashii]